jgi:hypothetical protein
MHLTPTDDSVIPAVNRVVFRQVTVRRMWRLIMLIVKLAILAGLIWGGWWLYHFIRTR